jgi:mono/diheme cytochrome c family protein
MRPIMSWVGVALIAVALAIQMVPYGRRHTNPPVSREPQWDRPETRALVARACFDCHRNGTAWPWTRTSRLSPGCCSAMSRRADAL